MRCLFWITVHLQTKFESVVVHEEQEKCRDAIYRGDAGQAVNKAVHTSGLSFTRGRNNTITMANWPSHRWVCKLLLRMLSRQFLPAYQLENAPALSWNFLQRSHPVWLPAAPTGLRLLAQEPLCAGAGKSRLVPGMTLLPAC